MKELILKYNMKPYLSDAITEKQIGWYLVSDHYIPELDALAAKANSPHVLMNRETFAPGFIRYTLFTH